MATLQNLPEDVKRLVCAELEKVQSVRPIWQTSKTWRAAAEAFVYRGLTLAVSSKEFLVEDAQRLIEDEVARKYLEHARYDTPTSSERFRHSPGIFKTFDYHVLLRENLSWCVPSIWGFEINVCMVLLVAVDAIARLLRPLGPKAS
jgi:hypothetical protein